MNIGLRLKVLLRNVFLYMQIAVDKVRGIDFSIPVYHDEVNHVQTMSSTPIIFPVIKHFLNTECITREDAIIDVGCGKGRMVYLFSKFPFGQVAGLEYSKEVFKTAVRNVEKLTGVPNGGAVLLVNGDAKFYSDYDRYNYFYLFNPFHGDIMEGFITNLKGSIDRKNREITIIYFNPRDKDLFVNAGFRKTQNLGHGIEIFRNK